MLGAEYDYYQHAEYYKHSFTRGVAVVLWPYNTETKTASKQHTTQMSVYVMVWDYIAIVYHTRM